MSNEKLEERREAGESSASSATSGAGGSSREKGDIKADADKGGGQQGQKDGKDGAPAANPSFRFNPALMAPVNVAKAKEASGSERLRKVANELAQKIVERVRVGTNAMGKMEFQVDLKSDVLSGLSEIPIGVVSGFGVDVASAEQVGIDVRIAKPVSIEVLTQALQRMLRSRKAA